MYAFSDCDSDFHHKYDFTKPKQLATSGGA